MPHLFICTVNYNNLVGLKRTVASYSNIPQAVEYSAIIIDGGSTDGSAEFVKRSGLTHVVEKDRGTYDAMNKGIDWAYKNLMNENSYLIFMNSGDEFANDLSFLVEDLNRSNSDILIYKNFTDDGTKDQRFQLSLLKFGFMPFCHQSVLYSVSRLSMKELFFSLDTWSYNDYRQLCTLFKKGKSFEYKGNFLSIYEQITTTGLSRSEWKFRLEKIQILWSLYGLLGILRMLVFKISNNWIKVEA